MCCSRLQAGFLAFEKLPYVLGFRVLGGFRGLGFGVRAICMLRGLAAC